MSKASRGKHGETKVSEALRSIPNAYFVFDDAILENAVSEMSHQIDHILIHPHGLFVVETKNYSGLLEYEESDRSWYKTIRGKKTRISSPLRQNKAHAIALRKALKSQFKPIPVVVFVQNNAPYLGDENVINLADLPLFIDSYPFDRAYNLTEMKEMKALIEKALSSISDKEHVQNIRYLKQGRKEEEAEITFALEKGKCPWCGASIVSEGYSYRCSRCRFQFKL